MNPLLGLLAVVGVGLTVLYNTQYLNAKNLTEEERRKRRRGVPPIIGLGALLAFLGVSLGAGLGSGGPGDVQANGFGLKFAPVEKKISAGALSFTYPTDGEQLDAQDFLLEGRGTPGQELEIFQGGQSLGKVTVGEDGTWSWPISRPKPGDYEFEVRPVGATEGIKLAVNVGPNRPEASNAKCPCSLRVSTNRSGATIQLLRDGQTVGSGTGPVMLFRNLEKASYGIQVEAPNYKTYQSPVAKFSTPKNKYISVYLDPAPK
jgi:hypothetical protein